MAVIAGLAILALLVVGFATGNIRFFVTSDPPVQPRPAEAVPQTGAAKDGVLRGSVVSFRYPKRWQVLHAPASGDAGAPTSATTLGFDARDGVAVVTFPLVEPVISPDDFPRFRREVGQLMQQHAGTSHDGIIDGPIDRTLGGFHAVEYRLLAPGPGGSDIAQRIVVSARGSTEFWVNCFSTKPHRAAIQKGCDQILRTFAIR